MPDLSLCGTERHGLACEAVYQHGSSFGAAYLVARREADGPCFTGVAVAIEAESRDVWCAEKTGRAASGWAVGNQTSNSVAVILQRSGEALLRSYSGGGKQAGVLVGCVADEGGGKVGGFTVLRTGQKAGVLVVGGAERIRGVTGCPRWNG